MTEQNPERKITFKAVSTPDLKPDMSNLDQITLPKFLAAIRGENGHEVVRRALEEMQAVAAQGAGVQPDSLPQPLHQTGLECQTMALLNGIQAWEGADRIQNLVSNLPDLREKAKQHSAYNLDASSQTPDPNAVYSMRAVSEVLADMGYLKRIALLGNPIQAARQLFKDHTFLGVSQTDLFHAHTVLPLAQASDQNYALRLDSLGGRQDRMPSNQFLNLLLNKQMNDFYSFYEVVPKEKSSP